MSEAEEGLKEKFRGLYEGPFRISRVTAPSIYEVSNLEGNVRGLFLCFVERASRYNCVKKTNLMHNLFLVHFVNFYMFRAYLGPSSGSRIVCIQQLVIIILFRLMSVVLVGLKRIISINCCIHMVLPPDNGPRYARNM
jgi:hypothetical protein